MSITLTDGVTPVTLHPDLLWSDEFTWDPVEQNSTRTITGAQVLQTAHRVAGRPITLQPEDDRSGWMTRSVVEQLRNWSAVPGKVLQLTLRGVTRNVVFRHQDGAGIEAKPVVHFSEMDNGDHYLVTVRIMEI